MIRDKMDYDATFCETNKGKSCVVANGYRQSYVHKNGNKSWRCVDKQCSARIQTDGEGRVVIDLTIVQHSHEFAIEDVSVVKCFLYWRVYNLNIGGFILVLFSL
jgi:hypothetical protein